LVAITSCFGPALTTYVSPSSLINNSLPSKATGEAVNVAGAGMRPPS
jgi:hypothetical protein